MSCAPMMPMASTCYEPMENKLYYGVIGEWSGNILWNGWPLVKLCNIHGDLEDTHMIPSQIKLQKLVEL